MGERIVMCMGCMGEWVRGCGVELEVVMGVLCRGSGGSSEVMSGNVSLASKTLVGWMSEWVGECGV